MRTYSILTLFWLPFILFAQPWTIKKLGLEQGLSNSYILSITQDRDGYMWFATESGLNRFDGQNFKVYLKNTTPASSINSNELNKVLADRNDHTLWIATQRTGLNAFNTQTEKFTYYTNDPGNPYSIATNDITGLAQAADGNLWVSTYHKGVDYFDKKNGRFTHFNQSTIPALVSNHVWCMADDGHGKLYIGHVFDGLTILSVKERKVRNYTYKATNQGTDKFPGTEVICLYIDKKYRVWVGTNNGLVLFNPKTEKFTVFQNIPGKPASISSNRILSIREMSDEKLWIGTSQGGVNILDLRQPFSNPEEVSFQHIMATEDVNGLSFPNVRDVYEDSFHNIWIGMYGGNINVISSQKPLFNAWSYSPQRGIKNSLSNKMVTGICTDNEGKVWIETDGGGIDLFENGQKTGHFCKELGTLPNNYMISAIKDSEGNLWFGSGPGNLIRYNTKNKQFTQITNVNSITNFRCIYEDKDKNMWLGTNLGLYFYNPATGNVKFFTQNNSRLPDNVVTSISQDIKGRIWVGTLGQGVAIFTPDFRLLQVFNKSRGFCSNAINHIYRDSENRMWVGTWEGLALFSNTVNLHFKVYTEREGMADSYVCAIVEGKPNQIWFSTHNGISQFSPKDHKFLNFNYLDGIPRVNFVSGSVAKNIDGTIYFGSQSGVCFFNSNQILLNKKVPSARITDFSYFDKRVAKAENDINLPLSEQIELKHYQNTFSISYNVLDFALNDQAEFSYMLKGFENTWYNVGNEKKVTFRNIPPGRYEFKVRSRLRNQDWSEEITSVNIIISPPLWLTWWAKTLYFIIIVLLAQYLLRLYKRKLVLENSLSLEQSKLQQIQDLNNERMSFYTNITHELRTPLTLIIGPLEDLINDMKMQDTYRGKIRTIHNSALRLLDLINQILEFRKTETQNRKLNVQRADLAKQIQEIALKYEELNRNPELMIKHQIEAGDFNILYDPEVITIILDNLISNAIKYTPEGEINILLNQSIENGVGYTDIKVNDTGYGIDQASLPHIFDRYYQVNSAYQASGTGIGLAIARNLVELHEGEISVNSQPGEGTIFRIRLITDNFYPNAIHSEVHQLNIEEQQPDSRPILLVVEDNQEIRKYVSETFVNDFEVLEAANGREGLDIAYSRIPDIIISDVMMPIMNGIEFCKSIKEDLRTSHIPFIMLTAKDTIQDKTDGYSVGADSYITKPFSGSLLRSRIINLLEARKRFAEQFEKSIRTNQEEEINRQKQANPLDNEFISQITKYIEEHLTDENINIGDIADLLCMSHSTLYRKVKALTGMTVNELIRKIRLMQARDLLTTGKYYIAEVMFMVGFSSGSYFRNCFKEEFGLSPSEMIKQCKK